jgi:hypothetical protein
LAPFLLNGETWSIIPDSRLFLKSGTFRWDIDFSYMFDLVGTYFPISNFVVESEDFIQPLNLPPFSLITLCFFIFILFGWFYTEIFRNYFFPLYYYFGVDNEENEEDDESDDWNAEGDDEEEEDEIGSSLELLEDDFYDSYGEHKNSEYYLDWYKENHPFLYWHILISRLFSSKFHGEYVDTTTYHFEWYDEEEEDGSDELEPEEWESEFDLIVILLVSASVEVYVYSHYYRTVFFKVRPRIEWAIDAENLRVLSSGDLFVLNHTMTNFSELFSDVWNNYIVNSWAYSEQNLEVKPNYYKLYCDNLLLDPVEHLSYSQVFINLEDDIISENFVSFEDWAKDHHSKREHRLSLYNAAAPPSIFIDLKKAQPNTSLLEYTKTHNLLSLVTPSFDDNNLLYKNDEFQLAEYVAYTKRLQKKLGLFNEDLLEKYDWNRKSRYRWLKFRAFPSKEELNNLIEDVRLHTRKSKFSRRRKMRKYMRLFFSKSRVNLGDYLMFLQTYRLHPKRKRTQTKFLRKYANAVHNSLYPRIFPFGHTYSFFSPESPLFLNSRFETQFQIDHWAYFLYGEQETMKHFKKKRKFGLTWIRPLILPRFGHLLRDYLSDIPNNLMESLQKTPLFKPSYYLKLDGRIAPKVSKLYNDDIVGQGRHDWLFLLNDNFWYLWRDESPYGLETAFFAPRGNSKGITYKINASDDNIISYISNYLNAKTRRLFDFHSLYFHEGKVSRYKSSDITAQFHSKRLRLRFRKIIKTLKKSLRQYVFLQAYVDILQSKYGSVVGLFMFNSPGNTLNVLSKTLFDFTIDYSWYEKTHYIKFPDQSFSQKDVRALETDLYGPVENPYGFFHQSYDNPLSSFPPSIFQVDYNWWLEGELFVNTEADLVQESNQSFLYPDESSRWKGFPFMESKQWPTDKLTPGNIDFLEYFSSVLNNYRPYNAKNSIVLNFLIDPVGLLLTQRQLYNSWLSLNPSFLPPSSNFFSAFKYFKNFLAIPDFSYLDQKWNIFFFIEQQKKAALTEFQSTFISDPEEDFVGFTFFKNLTDYFYKSPFTVSTLVPSIKFVDLLIKQNFTSNITYFTEEPLEDFTGCIFFPFLNLYDLCFYLHWDAWKLLFNKTYLILQQVFSKVDPVDLYLAKNRSIFVELNLTPQNEVDYFDDIPPFEDFLQDISYSWWDRWNYFEWPTKSLEATLFDYFNVIPPAFEDFLQTPDLEFSYLTWCDQIKVMYSDFFLPQFETWWREAYVPSWKTFKKELNYTTGKESGRLRSYAADAEPWYYEFFLEFYEPYLSTRSTIKDYFKRGWFDYSDLTPFFQGGESHTWEIWSMLFASNDDSIAWMLMPYFHYFPVQAKLEHNEFGPYDAQEFVHILHMEPFFLFHDLEITSGDADIDAVIRDDFEVELSPESGNLEMPDYRNSPYRDDDEDPADEDDDFFDAGDEPLAMRLMAGFCITHYERMLTQSIDYSKVDWLTRLVLSSIRTKCDFDGNFHFKKIYPRKLFQMETMDGASLKGKAQSSDVFWNDEGLEEGVLTSYAYPMGRHGAWRGRRGIVPVTIGTFKKGLAFEGIDREDDTGDWWYDDLDLWDFWRGEIRNGNKLLQTSVDGDFGSYEKGVYRDDFVFYTRRFPHKRLTFPRDNQFFSFLTLMEEEDDMDCFEMSWEDEDDFYIYNPYRNVKNGPTYVLRPGEAKAFISQVFRTPAWHGYPIPIDQKGWVYISWLWRFAKSDDLSYGLEYDALTQHKSFVKYAARKGFWSYFGDTFGLFTQMYTGVRRKYVVRPELWPHFGRLSKLSHDMRLAKGLGADLTFPFWKMVAFDATRYDDIEGDDGILVDDWWDDEEHPMDCYDDGSEFNLDDISDSPEMYNTAATDMARGRGRAFYNRMGTWSSYYWKDGLYDEEPYPEDFFDYHVVSSALPFLKSFDFFKNSYDANMKIPFVMDTMVFKLNRIEVEDFPWRVYNFVGERDLNLNQTNSVTKPYIFEDMDYNYDVRKWRITDLMYWYKRYTMSKKKIPIEDLDEYRSKLTKLHQRKFWPKFHRDFFFATKETIDLQSLSKDYLYLFLNRHFFSSFIQDEVCKSDVLNSRYNQSRFAFQESMVLPYVTLKNPVFSLDWFSELRSLLSTKKKVSFALFGEKLPYGPLNKTKTIEGMRAFIPNKNEYFHYDTHLKPKEENSMIRDFSMNYLMLWQERARFYTWQYRNIGANYNGTFHKLKSGTLKCISRFNFSSNRFVPNTVLSNTPVSFLSLRQKSVDLSPLEVIGSNVISDRYGLGSWYRSWICYPFTILSYYINLFNNIPFSFQWDLRHWLFEVQGVSNFYSFFWMLVSWSIFGIYV